MIDARLEELKAWLVDSVGLYGFSIAPASADASFRRYFRVTVPGRSLIAMDAPPDKEDCHPFVKVARAFKRLGVNVPEILEEDYAKGFLLLSDLGTQLYLDVLNDENVDALYGDAMQAIIRLQHSSAPMNCDFAFYDHALLNREMALCSEWFFSRHMDLPQDEVTTFMLKNTYEFIIQSALEQPQFIVHRDYHSRNLMIAGDNNPGILDFQDALIGPATYDLVSLLKDCYVAWPRERVVAWVENFRLKAQATRAISLVDSRQFLRWFDWMGVQRHIKVLGIFARLNYRDGKSGYLKDLPRTLNYILEVTSLYPELTRLDKYLRENVVPRLNADGTVT